MKTTTKTTPTFAKESVTAAALKKQIAALTAQVAAKKSAKASAKPVAKKSVKKVAAKKVGAKSEKNSRVLKWLKGKENPAREKGSVSFKLFEIARKGGTVADFYAFATANRIGGGAYLQRLVQRGCIASLPN